MHIGSIIRYEKALYGNYFLICYIVKRILMSINCFIQVYNSGFPGNIYVLVENRLPPKPTYAICKILSRSNRSNHA